MKDFYLSHFCSESLEAVSDYERTYNMEIRGFRGRAFLGDCRAAATEIYAYARMS